MIARMSESGQDPGRADISAPRQTRWLIGALVVMIHVSVILGLIQAFAPDFSARMAEQVLATFTITVTTPPPSPKPPPPAKAPDKSGRQGEIGRKAVPKEQTLPKPKLALASPSPAPRATSTGTADSSGTRDTGQGTGSGGQGSGTGSGNGGNGQGGGGLARRFVQIAGTIDSAKDYPKATRDLRIGRSVLVVFTIGTDGRVHNCLVREASGDAQADAITCRLAESRFRFRPSLDGNGNPVEATYGWRQRWFYPGQQN